MIDIKKLLRKGVIVGLCLGLSAGLSVGGFIPAHKFNLVYAATVDSEEYLAQLREQYEKEHATYLAEYSKPENADNFDFTMVINGHEHYDGEDFVTWIDAYYKEFSDWYCEQGGNYWDEKPVKVNKKYKIVAPSKEENSKKEDDNISYIQTEKVKQVDLTAKNWVYWNDKNKFDVYEAYHSNKSFNYSNEEIDTLSKFTLSELSIPVDYKNTSYVYGSGSRTESFKDYFFIGGLVDWRGSKGDMHGGALGPIDVDKVYTKEELCTLGTRAITMYNMMCSGYDDAFCKNLAQNKDEVYKNYNHTLDRLLTWYVGATSKFSNPAIACACYSAIYGETVDFDKLLDKDGDGCIDYITKLMEREYEVPDELYGIKTVKEAKKSITECHNVNIEAVRSSGKFNEEERKSLTKIQKQFKNHAGWYAKSVSVSESKKGIVKVFKTCAGGTDSVWVKPLKEGKTTLTIKVTLDDGTVVKRKTEITVGKKGSKLSYNTQLNPLRREGYLYEEYGNVIYATVSTPVGELTEDKRDYKRSDAKVRGAVRYYSGVDKYLCNGGSQEEAYNMMLKYIKSYRESLKKSELREKYNDYDSSYILDYILNGRTSIDGFVHEVGSEIGSLTEVRKVDGATEYYINIDGIWRMVNTKTLELKKEPEAKFKKITRESSDVVNDEDISLNGITYTINSKKGGYLYTHGALGSYVYKIKPGKQTIQLGKTNKDYNFDYYEKDTDDFRNTGYTDTGYAWFIETTSDNRLIGSERLDIPESVINTVKITYPWIENNSFSAMGKGDTAKIRLMNSDIKDWDIKVSDKKYVSVSKNGTIKVLKELWTSDGEYKEVKITLTNKKDKRFKLVVTVSGEFNSNWGGKSLDNAATGHLRFSSDGYNKDIYYNRLMYTDNFIKYFDTLKGKPNNYNSHCPKGYDSDGNNIPYYSKKGTKITKNDSIW